MKAFRNIPVLVPTSIYVEMELSYIYVAKVFSILKHTNTDVKSLDISNFIFNDAFAFYFKYSLQRKIMP